MRVSDHITAPPVVDEDRLARLEQRVAQLEAQLGLAAAAVPARPVVPPAGLAPVFTVRAKGEEEDFESELGQHWFALAGIAVLTAGLAFLVSLPYPSLPNAIPALGGAGLCFALVAIGAFCRRSQPRIAGYLRGAAMALLAFAGLRLFFFGAQPVTEINGPVATTLLIAIGACNVFLGVRAQSRSLTGAALVIAAATALWANTAPLVLLTILGIAAVTVLAARREKWAALLLVGAALVPMTYLGWALGNPLHGGGVHVVKAPWWAPDLLLALLATLGVAPLLRSSQRDQAIANVASFLNCALGYGALLVHVAAAFPTRFAALQIVAAIALVGLAMAFYLRAQSRGATFFYAMTGYAALTFAILKLSHAPNVFVWLSAQSVIVVATAICFRSRFIVVGNFFIFAAIVLAYIATTKHESGISIGFGLVALATARILNWQQHRLELKTELMRNTYLASAFVIFPYAAYHLVPAKYVALVWVALAAAYYALNLVVRNQKYRWMGHGTLVLATGYVVLIGVSRFEPVYRVLSFLVLGATLLTVSVMYARAKRS